MASETRIVKQEKVACPDCGGEGQVWCDGPSELGQGPFTCSTCHGQKYVWRNVDEGGSDGQ